MTRQLFGLGRQHVRGKLQRVLDDSDVGWARLWVGGVVVEESGYAAAGEVDAHPVVAIDQRVQLSVPARLVQVVDEMVE
jgi:hypothetical protein